MRVFLSRLLKMAIRKAPDTSKSRGIELHLGRRRFGTALFAAVSGGLLTRKADGFPRGADADFRRATRILIPYGLSVDGAFDDVLGHDVLKVTSLPQLETQYDFVVGDLNEVGGIEPCILTSFFQGSAEFTSFEENQAGGIIPCTKTAVGPNETIFEHLDVNAAGGILPCTKTTVATSQTIFEHLDINAAGGIIPCSRTTIEDPHAMFELFDENEAGGVDPCWIVDAEHLADGRLGAIEVTVNDPELTFTVRIGARTYRLVNGALVED